MPPIRAWLDSIGSPYGGPGHMIDPLAHAHMNLVGGVVMLVMGVTYYLLPILSGRKIYSVRLVEHSFWLMTLGVYGFYAVQMVFGIWEGYLMFHDTAAWQAVHHWYGRLVAVAGTSWQPDSWPTSPMSRSRYCRAPLPMGRTRSLSEYSA